MSDQKFRADVARKQPDGSTIWYARWMGGDTLAKIENCLLEGLEGNMRRTVYITGDADTYFSVPAVCRIQGCRVTGFVTRGNNDGLVFHHCYY